MFTDGRKWRQQLVLEWSKGHPEKRDNTRASWTPVDWMNHVADRAAEAEYGRTGGEDAPGCLRHQGRWRLEWNGMRVTSVTNDALNRIQEELPWRELLREQDCDPSGLDVQATKVATGYTGVAVKRTQNVRMMWDRYPLRANMWHWRQRPRQWRSGPLWWYHDFFFFVISDPLTPYAYAPPWTPLNPGFYSISGGCRNS